MANRSARALAFLLFVVGSSAPAQDRHVPWAQFKKLDEDLSMDEVERLLGEPTAITQETCGSDTPNGGWSCRIWVYWICDNTECRGNTQYKVLFRRSKGPGWVVNSWYKTRG